MLSRTLINDESPMSGVLAADYTLAREINQDGYITELEALGMREGVHFEIRTKPITITHLWGIKQRTIFLSAEKPRKIKAYTFSHGNVDEFAIMGKESPMNFAGRLRCPKARLIQTLYTFTWEGENHAHEKFGETNLVREGKHSTNARALVLHGTSYDNPDLPRIFFENLFDAFGWDEALFNNYVLGVCMSLSRDRFYFKFSPQLNVKPQTLERDNKHLFLTVDWNVGKMSWSAIQKQYSPDFSKPVYSIIRANRSNAQDLLIVAQQIVETFPPDTFKDWTMEIMGDARGNNRSDQDASVTGYKFLKLLLSPHYPGLRINAPRNNPEVWQRSVCTNRLFGQGRLLIDPSCTKVIESAKMAEGDGKGGIKKPKDDTVTHAMEAVDMALMRFEPPEVERGYAAYNFK